MKKILFLFLLLPYLCFAEFYEGTIKFTNGSTQNGLFEYPDAFDTNIKFKPTKNDKAQQFSIDEIDEVDFPSSTGKETIRVIATKFYESTMKGKVKGLSAKKIFIRLYYDGKIKMYSVSNMISYPGAPGGFDHAYEEIAYYLKSPSKDYPQLVFKAYPKGAAGAFKIMKMQLGKYFEQDCPALEASLDKSIVKENSYYQIGEFFDKNCAK